jgi:hypothetical protein
MFKQTLIILALLGSFQLQAGMSDIHYQTTEAIYSHFSDYEYGELTFENMQFGGNLEGCSLTVSTDVKTSAFSREADYNCEVCFDKRGERNYVWTDVVCK